MFRAIVVAAVAVVRSPALEVSRRSLGNLAAQTGATLAAPQPSFAVASCKSRKAKVTVVGGDGFIGSRVCRELVARGATVTSISRRGKPPAGAGDWAKSVRWLAADVLEKDVSKLAAGSEAVVSCLGVILSGDDERGNGEANARVAAAATKVGAKRFAYVSVHPLVEDLGAFEDYMAGKKRAEEAIRGAGFGQAVIVRPTLVYGGDAFALKPPRVPDFWGKFVEATLSTDVARAAADAMPIAPLKVALLPPVDVDTTARALALVALGYAPDAKDVVGRDEIKAVAGACGVVGGGAS